MPSRTTRISEIHCRMRPEELALLDELTRHFGEESRAQMIRAMMRKFRAKMLRDRARGIGEADPAW